MTKLLDTALKAARNLPETLPLTLTSEEQAAVAASKAAAVRGEFATDEQVREVWAKHHL